jgi:capsular exopolysaccharide synthesis family protein
LTTIPVIKNEKEIPDKFEESKRMDERLITIDYAPTPGSEAFRNLRTKLVLGNEKKQKKTLIVTSLNPNEGKSLVTANLAITFAQLKHSTLLIDGDMRRGVQHNSFMINKKPGLTDLLAKPQSLTIEIISSVIQKTTIPNLYVISSGMDIPNPTEILIGDKLEQLLSLVQKRFNYVIIDTPPIGLIPDSLIFNEFVHEMIFVTRYAKTDMNQLQKRLKEYPELRKDLKGMVLNASSSRSKNAYDGYSYYKY